MPQSFLLRQPVELQFTLIWSVQHRRSRWAPRINAPILTSVSPLPIWVTVLILARSCCFFAKPTFDLLLHHLIIWDICVKFSHSPHKSWVMSKCVSWGHSELDLWPPGPNFFSCTLIYWCQPDTTSTMTAYWFYGSFYCLKHAELLPARWHVRPLLDPFFLFLSPLTTDPCVNRLLSPHTNGRTAVPPARSCWCTPTTFMW